MTNSQRMRDEPGDQVLGDAIGKVLLIGIAAHIGERQHRDRGTVGQRQMRILPVCRGIARSGAIRRRRPVAARRSLVLADFADEADAFARQCLDQSLLVAGIADRAPGRVDPVEERGLRDNAPMPHRGQQFILADDTVTVPDQMNEKIEDLGRDGHQGRSPAQFATIRVECAVLE